MTKTLTLIAWLLLILGLGFKAWQAVHDVSIPQVKTAVLR